MLLGSYQVCMHVYVYVKIVNKYDKMYVSKIFLMQVTLS